MLRRLVSGAVLSLALAAASLGWFGFVALHTLLDPGRSDAVAHDVYDDPGVRDQLAANIAVAVERALPRGVTVPRSEVDAAARAALDDPRVEAVVVDAFVRTHHAFLGQGTMPRTLDAGAFGAAARAALVALHPELDRVVPPAPTLKVALPTDHVPDGGGLRDALRTATPLALLGAAAGVALGALLAADRRRVLRRVGAWGVGAGLTWIAVGLGVPWLARTLLPGQAAVIAALVGAVCAAMVVPAGVVAGGGALAWLGGRFWPAGVGVRTRTVHTPRPPAATGTPASTWAATPPPSPPPRPVRPVEPAPYRPERTALLPRVRPPAPPAVPPPPAAPRWIEGVGYVDDPTTPDADDSGRY